MANEKPIHVVLVWHCKGDNCDQIHAAKYLGEKSKIQGTITKLDARGKSFAILCPKCGQRRWYHPEEITYVELDAPPPPEFRPII